MTFNLFDFGVMVMIMMMVMMMMTLLTRFPIYSLGACHFMKVSVIESL